MLDSTIVTNNEVGRTRKIQWSTCAHMQNGSRTIIRAQGRVVGMQQTRRKQTFSSVAYWKAWRKLLEKNPPYWGKTKNGWRRSLTAKQLQQDAEERLRQNSRDNEGRKLHCHVDCCCCCFRNISPFLLYLNKCMYVRIQGQHGHTFWNGGIWNFCCAHFNFLCAYFKFL